MILSDTKYEIPRSLVLVSCSSTEECLLLLLLLLLLVLSYVVACTTYLGLFSFNFFFPVPALSGLMWCRLLSYFLGVFPQSSYFLLLHQQQPSLVAGCAICCFQALDLRLKVTNKAGIKTCHRESWEMFLTDENRLWFSPRHKANLQRSLQETWVKAIEINYSAVISFSALTIPRLSSTCSHFRRPLMDKW